MASKFFPGSGHSTQMMEDPNSSNYSDPERQQNADEMEFAWSNDDRSVDDDIDYAMEPDHAMPKLARKETKNVQHLRFVLLFVILMTVGIVTGTYFFVNNELENDYELSFSLFANSVEASLGYHYENLDEGARNLADTITASSSATQPFPFVTLDMFETHGEHARDRSKMELIAYAPLVAHADKAEWEDFSVRNQDWIEESRATFLDHVDSNPVYLSGRISPYIYKRRHGIFPEPVDDGHDHVSEDKSATYAPLWYLSPPPFNAGLVNLDTFSLDEVQPLVKYAATAGKPGFSPVVDVEGLTSLQVSDADHLKFHQQFTTITEGIGYEQPHSLYVRPVYENKRKGTVSGVVLGVVAWDAYLADLLPEGVNGVMCVLRCTCDHTSHTYELNEETPTYLGEGDLHEPSYDHLARRIPFYDVKNVDMAEVDTGVCNYYVDLYPSATFEEAYESNIATISAVTIGSMFGLVVFIFVVYDWVVHDRNKKITSAAEKSSAVVNSLFPDVVRERIMQDENPDATRKELENEGESNSKPIADLFTDTTIMFADIVGFTAWSSMRQPSDVFVLLETLYSEFDRIARRRRVFKIETIGDCYVAACGVPKPNSEHYLVMARFASDCLQAFERLVKELEVTLGPDTAELGIRVGLHSGAVTGGVLRGDRARFQLFGDSMNTAARIESNGAKNKIHCSRDTAKLLIAAGKEKWVTPREDKINAKGKGKLQTYWIAVTARSGSSTESRSADGSDAMRTDLIEEGCDESGFVLMPEKKRLNSKTLRLCDWNVEILKRVLEKILAHRGSSKNKGKVESVQSFRLAAEGRPPSEEVVDIISLPEYNATAGAKLSDKDDNVVPDIVEEQLRSFVSNVAAMYKDNPFHNFEHASHVCNSVTKFMFRIVAPSDVLESCKEDGVKDIAATLHDHTYGITSDPLTQFACVFASLVHDVDHQGVPNAQLAKEKATIALVYGTSPAEQNSIDLSWNLFMEDQYKELRAAICGTADEFARFRQLVVNAVMATDIVDKKLKALRNARWETAFDEGHRDENPRDTVNRKATIVIEHLIQASDVAHTMQHWHIYRKWNERFFFECYQAYLDGRADADPSLTWYHGEIGFFDFYIIPLARKLKDCGVFGVSSDECLEYAEKNREEWAARGQEVVASMVEKVKAQRG